MNNLTNVVERTGASLQSPVLVIIQHLVLTRTCLINILKREFADFEILELATTADLDCVSGRDVVWSHWISGTGRSPIPLLRRISRFSPYSVPTHSLHSCQTAMTRAPRWRQCSGESAILPTSIPVEVAIAGLRLVLAGGVCRPLPARKQDVMPSLAYSASPELPAVHDTNGAKQDAAAKSVSDFTPREQHVLAELQLGLPNKLIAAKLNLSENTVKMHIQHIMRNFSAHNRTEAVLRWRMLLVA